MAIPFAISMWCGPPDDFLTKPDPEAVFTTMIEASFNLAQPACNQSYNYAKAQRFLSAAAKAGIQTLITDDRISNPDWNIIESSVDSVVKDYASSSSLYGYFLGDEPGDDPKYFANMARIFTELRSKDPHRIAYINLLPVGYGPFKTEADYKKYLIDYITIVNPQVFSFDHYPQDWDGEAKSDWYSTNLRIVRDVCSVYGKLFWVAVSAFPPNTEGTAATTIDQLRWQIMEAIRYSASGIVYWTYWTPPSSKVPALIDETGNRTARFDEVKKLNGDVHSLVSQTGEALFGRVRATPKVPGVGDLWLLNSSDPRTGDGVNTARRLSYAGWAWATQTMPGYGFVNQLMDINGFWLCARNDLLNRTFYVCNVLDNFHGGAGTLFRVTKSKVENLGGAGWADANGRNVIGRYFDSNGFWVSMD